MPRPQTDNPADGTIRSRKARWRAEQGIRLVRIEVSPSLIAALQKYGLVGKNPTRKEIASALQNSFLQHVANGTLQMSDIKGPKMKDKDNAKTR